MLRKEKEGTADGWWSLFYLATRFSTAKKDSKILKKELDFSILRCYINQALARWALGFLTGKQNFEKLEKSC